MSRLLHVAVARYEVGVIDGFDAFAAKFVRWVSEAVDAGAELLLFPEYFAMELAGTGGRLDQQVDLMQLHYEDFRALVARQARLHRVTICAGSYPVRDADGQVRNRSLIAFADGRIEHQDKLTMTRFESEEWHIAPGRGLRVFDIGKAKLGIAICYDSEFPAIAARLAEAGAELLLVPSCTDTLAGHHRVRIGCQARALENQCYVLQSSTSGSIEGSPSIDINIGAAGIYSPPDRGFSDDGLVALGALDHGRWLYAVLDFERIAAVRSDGQVLNFADRGRARLD